MSKQGWTTCKLCNVRKTRHESGVCVTCARARKPVPLAQGKEPKIIITEPLPGGCLKPRYVRPDRRKECPICHKTRDDLPEDLVSGSGRIVNVCEWCWEQDYLDSHPDSGPIIHTGCDCASCRPVMEGWIEEAKELKRLRAASNS